MGEVYELEGYRRTPKRVWLEKVASQRAEEEIRSILREIKGKLDEQKAHTVELDTEYKELTQ